MEGQRTYAVEKSLPAQVVLSTILREEHKIHLESDYLKPTPTLNNAAAKSDKKTFRHSAALKVLAQCKSPYKNQRI